MIYYAHVVRYIKLDPDSPGNLRSSELYEELINENMIPKKFNVNQQSVVEYIQLLDEIEQYTSGFPGIIGSNLTRDISVFLFDTLENLINYNTNKKQLLNWTTYENRRDSFLASIGLKFETESPKEMNVPDTMTPGEIVASIV